MAFIFCIFTLFQRLERPKEEFLQHCKLDNFSILSIIALHSKIEDDVNCNIWLVNNDTYENYYDDTEEVEGTMSVTLLGTVEGDTVTKDNVLVNMQLATSEDDVYA